MAKLDEIKEILNTLRLTLSIFMGILVLSVGSILSRYEQNKIDEIFWIGIFFIVIFLLILVLIIKRIAQRTKEIKEL